MTMSYESHPASQAIVGLRNLILDPDEVRNGTRVNIPQYRDKTEGDVITLRWESSSTFTSNVTVNGSNADAPIPVRIAYDPYIIGNLDNSVSVIYEVKRQNGRIATSQPLSFLIKRQLAQSLLAPTVREAAGDTLNPIQARNGATVRVAYSRMQAGDVLTVDWQGEGDRDSYQSAQQNGSAFGYVDFAIPVSVVAASQGKTITVRYAVVRGDNPGVLSEPLALVVGELREGDLPTPTVREARQNILDLADFAGDATVEVGQWPLIVQGQRYWIVARGTSENGEYPIVLARGLVVSDSQAGTGLSVRMMRSELLKLTTGSSLIVIIKVTFDGAEQEARALQFPPLTLQVKNLPTEEFDDLNDQPRRYLGNGESLSLKFMTITPSWTVRGSCQIEKRIHMSETQPVAGNVISLTLVLNRAATFMQFYLSGGGTVYAYDENNQLVHQKDEDRQGIIEIKPTSARKFKKVVFSTVQRANWTTENYFDDFRVVY
ncbi:hypothetical protein [Pseudomonas putida]|uniref:hypothetical protein n=1 Tax=Pseudomonas putida TaxID=303 RepID=UPI002364FD00|nr:hypothetical protein [Pseudomonas putida]MDD2050493.1 hypothetical protein [Pseudomonas putida]